MQNARKQSADDYFSDLSSDVSGLSSRVKIVEERYVNLRKKTQLTEQSLIDLERDTNQSLKEINADILDIKRGVQELREKMDMVMSEISDSVNSHELKVLERYLDIWEPMDFVTRKELEENFK